MIFKNQIKQFGLNGSLCNMLATHITVWGPEFIPPKKQELVFSLTLALCGVVVRNRRIPGACWPTSIAKQLNLRFSERPGLKKMRKEIEKDTRCWPLPCIHTEVPLSLSHIHTHAHTRTHTVFFLDNSFLFSSVTKVYIEVLNSQMTCKHCL